MAFQEPLHKTIGPAIFLCTEIHGTFNLPKYEGNQYTSYDAATVLVRLGLCDMTTYHLRRVYYLTLRVN